LTGNVTGGVTGNLTGNVTGNVTGNLTGDVTGDVTGNLTGNVTGNITGTTGTFSGNVSVGGTLTYEDVTNVDSVGMITARKGIQVLADGINAVGVVTATSLDVNGDTDISGTATLGGITGNVFSNVTTTATSKTIINREYCVVTASGQTITLPASPTSGDQVLISVLDFTDTVIGRNGQNIMGLAEDCTINTAQSTINLVYIDSSRGWRIS
jgi:hypothetical protein